MSDVSCDCCGRHLSELKPYGKAGDPLVGDFNGALLVRIFRRDYPPDPEVERIMDEFFWGCHSKEDCRMAEERLIEEYGAEDAENIQMRERASAQVSSYWLCRDCIILDYDEFFKKLYPDYAANPDKYRLSLQGGRGHHTI
jgi:hypothetical protein